MDIRSRLAPRFTGLARLAALGLCASLIACGGDDDGPATPAAPPVTAQPVLTITQQPSSATVAAGAVATFTVAAACSTGTLDVQWQRNSGADGAFAAVSGATAASLAVTTGIADDAAQFRAALDCGGRSATTSSVATLDVSAPGSARVEALPVTGLRPQGAVGHVVAVTVGPDGSVTFTSDNVVRRLSADLSSITRVAGSGSQAITDGPAASASFSQLLGAVADGAGNVYLSDNSALRRIAADGSVTTLAGSGSGGNADGPGATARFGQPRGIALGPDGDLYVADSTGYTIRRVSPAGVVSTYAGNGQRGYVDGAPGIAQFDSPWGIAVAANGDVLVSDFGNNRVRRIARNGNVAGAVTTLAGNGLGGSGADGIGAAAVIEHPTDMVVRGNTLTLLQAVGLVRQVDLATGAVTTLTGIYSANPYGFADGGPGKALFTGSGGIAALPDGRFIVADSSVLRVVSATGDVRTIAVSGGGDAFADAGGVLAQRPFVFASNDKQTLTVDASGRVVVANQGDVRRIDATGAVSVVAGLPGSFVGMVDGTGTEAQFSALGSGIAAAPDGTLFVSDGASLRRIAPSGQVTLLAGYRVTALDTSGGSPFGAVDGDAATARFQNALALAVGPDGALYVADTANQAIRRVDSAGDTTTWAGALGQSGTVDGARAGSRFRGPQSIAFAADGSLYVVDFGALRKVSADGATVSTPLPSGAYGRVAVDPAGNVFLTAPDGLYEMAAGTSAPVLVIAGGNDDALVTGTAPHLGRVDAMAVLGTGQLAMISGYQLVKVTLP